MLREEATVLTGMLIGLSAIDFRCVPQEGQPCGYSAPCSPGAHVQPQLLASAG